MTDELTPEQEADIRRLLAEARHDEATPAHVVARLDAVLGGLSANDVEVARTAAVTDLAGVRHRRRNAGRLLLAAAAVMVGGVTVGQVIGNNDANDSSADSPASAHDDLAEKPRDVQQESGGDTSAGAGAAEDDQPSAPAPASAQAFDQRLLSELRAPLQLTEDNFADEVETNLVAASAARRKAADQDLDGVMMYAATSLFTCPDADYGRGAKLPAYYDEQEAVLVLRRPVAGVQRVDLLACGTAETLDSVDLPAP